MFHFAVESFIVSRVQYPTHPLPYTPSQHHSTGVLNGWWRRQRYDHAGQPVFKASGHFLYFRPALTTDAEPQKDPISRSSGASGLSAAEPAHENEIADGGGGDGGDMGGRWVIDKAIRVGGVPVSA